MEATKWTTTCMKQQISPEPHCVMKQQTQAESHCCRFLRCSNSIFIWMVVESGFWVKFSVKSVNSFFFLWLGNNLYKWCFGLCWLCQQVCIKFKSFYSTRSILALSGPQCYWYQDVYFLQEIKQTYNSPRYYFQLAHQT